jgi:hypothetical protein
MVHLTNELKKGRTKQNSQTNNGHNVPTSGFFAKYSYSGELSKCLPGHINSDQDLRPLPLKVLNNTDCPTHESLVTCELSTRGANGTVLHNSVKQYTGNICTL